jgi:hypothetical protein
LKEKGCFNIFSRKYKPASFKGAGFFCSLHFYFGGNMDVQQKKLEVFGVKVTITQNGDVTTVAITKQDAEVKLHVDAPYEPLNWSGCGVMC